MPEMSLSNHLLHAEPRWVSVRDAVATGFEALAPGGNLAKLSAADNNAKTRGCLYDANGVRVQLSLRTGGDVGNTDRSADPETLPEAALGGDVPRLAGRTLYLGTIMNQYGHFITESLSRFWWHEPAEEFDHIVGYGFLHDRGTIFIQDFHRHMAGSLGIPIKRMVKLTEPVRFDEIIVPEQLWVYGRYVNIHMRPIYARIAERHVANRSSGRIFLARPSYPGARLSNVPEVEDVFAAFGFKVIYPEEHPIERQLSLYANCEILAGVSGSGMHNCLFSRRGVLTIEVGDSRTRGRPHSMQVMANELAEVNARFIPFEGTGDGRTGDGRTDPAAVRARLMDILGERPRIAPVLALRFERTAIHWLAPRLAARRRRRVRTKGYRR